MEVPDSREVPAVCSPPKCASLDGMSALQAQQGPTVTEIRCNSGETSVLLVGMSAKGAQQGPIASGIQAAELGKRTREMHSRLEFKCCLIELSNATDVNASNTLIAASPLLLIGLGLAVSAASATLYFGALIATEPGRAPPPLKTRVFGFIAILVFAQVAALAMTVSLLPIISWIVGRR